MRLRLSRTGTQIRAVARREAVACPLRAISFIAVVFGLAGCAACGAVASSRDSADAGLDETRVDVHEDASRRDGVATDGGADSAVVNCDAVSNSIERWQRVPFACRCDARIALSPESAAPALQWRRCADTDDCLQMVVDWRGERARSDWFELRGYKLEGQRWVAYRRSNRPAQRDKIVFARVDSVPSVVWDVGATDPSTNEGCSAELLAGPSLGLHLYWADDASGNVVRNAVAIGTPGNGSEWREPVVEFVGQEWRSAIIPYFSAFGRSVATANSANVWRSDERTRRFDVIASAADLRGDVDAVQLIGDQTWFLLTRHNSVTGMMDDSSLWVAVGRGRPMLVYQPETPRSLAYHIVDDQIVFWEELVVESDGRPIRRESKMFVAPRVTARSAFVPRLLWTMPADYRLENEFVGGGGWAALQLISTPSDKWLAVVRLSDGARIDLRDSKYGKLGWIDDHELAVSVSVDGHFTWQRLALRSLGAPHPMQ